jgi:hypothetical protein
MREEHGVKSASATGHLVHEWLARFAAMSQTLRVLCVLGLLECVQLGRHAKPCTTVGGTPELIRVGKQLSVCSQGAPSDMISR